MPTRSAWLDVAGGSNSSRPTSCGSIVIGTVKSKRLWMIQKSDQSSARSLTKQRVKQSGTPLQYGKRGRLLYGHAPSDHLRGAKLPLGMFRLLVLEFATLPPPTGVTLDHKLTSERTEPGQNVRP